MSASGTQLQNIFKNLIQSSKPCNHEIKWNGFHKIQHRLTKLIRKKISEKAECGALIYWITSLSQNDEFHSTVVLFFLLFLKFSMLRKKIFFLNGNAMADLNWIMFLKNKLFTSKAFCCACFNLALLAEKKEIQADFNKISVVCSIRSSFCSWRKEEKKVWAQRNIGFI